MELGELEDDDWLDPDDMDELELDPEVIVELDELYPIELDVDPEDPVLYEEYELDVLRVDSEDWLELDLLNSSYDIFFHTPCLIYR